MLPDFSMIFANFTLSAFAWALLVSFLYGLAGYRDNAKKTGQKFDAKLFVKTVIISLLVALYITYLGLDPEANVTTTFAFLGSQTTIMMVLDEIVNALFGLKISYKFKTTPINLNAFTQKSTQEQVAIIKILNTIANAEIQTNAPTAPPN